MAGPEVSERDLVVHFSRIFSAAHRLAGDPSKCRNIHGHNYQASIRIRAGGKLDASGFVIPFDAVKGVIDAYDHAIILDEGDKLVDLLAGTTVIRTTAGPPSTERLAQQLADELLAVLDRDRLPCAWVLVNLRETEGIKADGHASYGTL